MRKLSVMALLILLYSCKSTKPELKLSNYTYDFGNVKKDSIYQGKAIIKNIGNDTLIIQQISPDCSCTNVYATKKQILPNDTCFIKFSYKTFHKIRKQENFISIIANTDSVVHLLQINAFVK
jgi:hypothetical protein